MWLRRDFAALNLEAGAEMEERGSRRGVLRRGAGLGAICGGLAAGIAGPPNRPAGGPGSGVVAVRSSGVRSGRALAGGPVLPGNYIPFTQACAIPVDLEPTSEGVAPWQPGAVFHGIAPEFFERRYAEFPDIPLYETHPTRFFDLRVRRVLHEYVPGVKTPGYAYGGSIPGPTIRSRVGQPCVVRTYNELDVELSTHLHGGHSPAHADGYPNFYVLPGRARDYYYPNTLPLLNGEPDFTESPSTMWMHDHAMDVAGPNVWYGLAGFYLLTDELEDDLVRRNVLPGAAYDIPLALQDRKFNSDGTLFYNLLDHNGQLGDVWLANGRVQPFLKVERRKYRLRLLNGCNARFLELRLSGGQPFTKLGKDSWLYPAAIEQQTILLSPGQRADVVVDFRDASGEVYLENILYQVDGRKPAGSLAKPVHLERPQQWLKFIVEGPVQADSASAEPGTLLKPHRVLSPAEAVATRVFEFQRRNGAWQVNKQYFDPATAAATPTLGTIERWIFRNGSGKGSAGWWHPVHVHLSGQQIIRVNGAEPSLADRFKSDVVILDGGGEAESLLHFRSFRGPFVLHCHTLEHEDLRMMLAMDPRVTATQSPQPIQAAYP